MKMLGTDRQRIAQCDCAVKPYVSDPREIVGYNYCVRDAETEEVIFQSALRGQRCRGCVGSACDDECMVYIGLPFCSRHLAQLLHLAINESLVRPGGMAGLGLFAASMENMGKHGRVRSERGVWTKQATASPAFVPGDVICVFAPADRVTMKWLDAAMGHEKNVAPYAFTKETTGEVYDQSLTRGIASLANSNITFIHTAHPDASIVRLHRDYVKDLDSELQEVFSKRGNVTVVVEGPHNAVIEELHDDGYSHCEQQHPSRVPFRCRKGDTVLKCIAPIMYGEEILVSYGKEYWRPDTRPVYVSTTAVYADAD